jgi:hypothetical protein
MHARLSSFLTCLSPFISSPFMSEGYLTESKIGLTAGPEYGGPGMPSDMRSWLVEAPLWILDGENAVT